MPWSPFSHIELEWQDTGTRRFFEGLASGGTLVHFDSRGSGLSDRKVEDLSLEARALDLEAVVDQLGLERFALWAPLGTGPVAITYAVEHPDRVSKLILWCSIIRGEDLSDATQFQGLIALAEKDWELFSETMASVLFGFSGGDKARQYANLVRESVSPETVLATLPLLTEIDVSELLPHVHVPTLVLHRRDMVFPSMEVARSLASQIPDARLVVVDGGSAHVGEHTDDIVRATGDFLGFATPEPSTVISTRSGTAIILFADIANSTGLTEELGDAAFREKARALDAALRGAISAAGGTPIEGKLLGDGVLATFNAAREAIACAAACHDAGSDVGLQLHVGIHAGDVIREDDNVFGGAVNVAARISDASEAGETLVSGTVRDLARTSAGVSFEDRGERELKGVSDAVRVWAVR
jgi:class 3 adenylate cyclase/pimeloyl-ACP methyl ester carboxylesterase